MKMAIDNRLRASANAKNDYQHTSATTASTTTTTTNYYYLDIGLQGFILVSYFLWVQNGFEDNLVSVLHGKPVSEIASPKHTICWQIHGQTHEYIHKTYMGVSENQGYLLRDPYNKDPTIQGARLGSPIFGKLPYTPRYTRIPCVTWPCCTS